MIRNELPHQTVTPIERWRATQPEERLRHLSRLNSKLSELADTLDALINNYYDNRSALRNPSAFVFPLSIHTLLFTLLDSNSGFTELTVSESEQTLLKQIFSLITDSDIQGVHAEITNHTLTVTVSIEATSSPQE